MLKSFFCSKQWALWAWGGLILLFAMVVLEVRVLVWLNGWYRETWDFLQNPHPLIKEAVNNPDVDWSQALPIEEGESSSDIKNIDDSSPETATNLRELTDQQIGKFWRLIGEFSLIVFPFIFLRAFTGFITQHYAFRWRQAITYAYFPLWGKTQHEIEGASQRLQQDPERFARLLESLGLGFFRAILTLLAFIPVLWSVSVEIMEHFAAAEGLRAFPISLPLFDWTANTMGSLVLAACVLALGGTAISFLVGIKLPGLEYNNQRVEARFRKPLTYGEDNKTYVNVGMLTELFTGLRFNYFRLYLHYSYFRLWSGLFLQFVIIADLMLIGAGVVLGVISLGFLNQISHAFSKVSESLSYFVDNWTTVTELMSVIKRLREFEVNIGYREAPIKIATEDAQKL